MDNYRDLAAPYHPTRWQKMVQRLAATRLGSALLAHTLQLLDRPFIRLSHGKTTLTTFLTGLPVVTLTTLGAKSGQPRRVPLIAIPLEPEGQQASPEARGASPGARGAGPEARRKVVLIASNFGRAHHPAWYYNLKANPHATLSSGDFTGEYLAHEATGEERDYAWQRAAFLYGGYNSYRQRASHRIIGVFVLTPTTGLTPEEANINQTD